MNPSTLKKAIDELQSENPRIDYVLGMLETLYEMSDTQTYIYTSGIATMEVPKTIPSPTVPLDEGGALDALAKAGLKTLPPQNEMD